MSICRRCPEEGAVAVISSGGLIRGRVLEVVAKAAAQVLFNCVQVNLAWCDGFYAG